jgi:hypothetical protein
MCRVKPFGKGLGGGLCGNLAPWGHLHGAQKLFVNWKNKLFMIPSMYLIVKYALGIMTEEKEVKDACKHYTFW